MGLKVLATSGVKKCLLGFIPAALLLIHAPLLFDTGERAAAVLLAAVFVLLGLWMALFASARAARTLRMMRHGLAAEGKIISCRLASESKETPYAEFLPNWMVHQSAPQAKVIHGFKWTVVAFVALLFVLLFLVAVALAVMNVLGATSFLNAKDALTLSLWIGSALVLALLTAGMVFMSRWRNAKEAAEEAANTEFIAPNPVRDALPPESYAGIALYCTVEYLVQGERRSAKARALLSARLDRSGTVPLLYPSSGRGRVVLLAGLPHQASVDARGQWEPVSISKYPVGLIVTGLIACATLAGFASYVPWLLTLR
jgi:hypothetical protein